MNNYKLSHNIHFIGIGGAGMAPLAKLLHDKGYCITGSDLEANPNTEKLSNLGIKISIGHNASFLPEIPSESLSIVYSSAVKAENPELTQARSEGCRCLKRGEMLAEFAKLYDRSVAISGSHGKTTISAMLSHILKTCNCAPGFLIGGKVNGWEFSAETGNSDIFVCEVDESDGTHALISPYIGVVPNIEDDHSWSVGGEKQLFDNFAIFAQQSENLIYIDNKNAATIFNNHPNSICYTKDGLLFKPLETNNINLCGQHQLMNANLAIHVAVKLGVPITEARKAILSFPGVARRMSLHFHSNKLVLLEDYAHHPTEVKYAISAFRERFPDYDLCVVFQPHRYARLEKYLEQFSCELRKADSVIITPVFAAWTDSSNVSAEYLAEKIGKHAIYNSQTWPEIAQTLLQPTKSKKLIAILGAGSIIDLVNELKANLSRT